MNLGFRRGEITLGCALVATLGLTGCPSPLEPPTASISLSSVSPDACEAATGPIDGRLGIAPRLTGRCSSDPQDLPLAYHWSLADQPSGSTATIHDAAVESPTFVPDVPGTYRLRLVVDDGVLSSDPAELEIAVGPCGEAAPVVDAIVAEPTASPATGQPVRLSATVTDADTEAGCEAHAGIFVHEWSFVSLPVGSAAALNDPSAETPSFTPDLPGTYVVRLVATDPTGLSGTSTVEVVAGDCGTNAPVATATATPAAVSPGTGVALTVVATDADVDTCGLTQELSYAWSLVGLPAGSEAALNGASGEGPTFVPDVPGTYVVEVVVTDSTGRTARSRVTVTVDDCGIAPPVAAAEKIAPGGTAPCGPLSTINVDVGGARRVQLDGASSFDPDNGTTCGSSQTLFYEWSLMRTPIDGGSSSLSTPDGQTTVLRVADNANGRYDVRLIVRDSTGRASNDVVCHLNLSNVGG